MASASTFSCEKFLISNATNNIIFLIVQMGNFYHSFYEKFSLLFRWQIGIIVLRWKCYDCFLTGNCIKLSVREKVTEGAIYFCTLSLSVHVRSLYPDKIDWRSLLKRPHTSIRYTYTKRSTHELGFKVLAILDDGFNFMSNSPLNRKHGLFLRILYP